MEKFIETAAGVFVGGLLALLAYEAISEARMEYAARRAVEQIEKNVKAEQSSVQRQQQLQREQRAAAEVAQGLERRGREIDAARERRAAEVKERAFDRYFVPSDACRADPASVECGNAHIRARAQFEREYRPID